MHVCTDTHWHATLVKTRTNDNLSQIVHTVVIYRSHPHSLSSQPPLPPPFPSFTSSLAPTPSFLSLPLSYPLLTPTPPYSSFSVACSAITGNTTVHQPHACSYQQSSLPSSLVWVTEWTSSTSLDAYKTQ